MAKERRSQQERRETTRAQVLESACLLFGKHGYADTALHDIADHAGVTTRPVYHYFGNKKELFIAATESLEEKLLRVLENAFADTADATAVWDAFLQLTKDKGFRQVVLIDAPNVLGLDRWSSSPVLLRAREVIGQILPEMPLLKQELLVRMISGAMTEVALMAAQADDFDEFAQLSQEVVKQLVAQMVNLNANR